MFEVLEKDEVLFVKILSFLHPKQFLLLNKKTLMFLENENSKLWEEYFFSKYKSFKNNLCSSLFLTYENHSYMGERSEVIELLPFLQKSDAIDWYKKTIERDSENEKFISDSLMNYDIKNVYHDMSITTSISLNSNFNEYAVDIVEIGVRYFFDSFSSNFKPIYKNNINFFKNIEIGNNDFIPDILEIIFQFLDSNDVLIVECVNKNWFETINQSDIWKTLFFQKMKSYRKGMFIDLCFGYHLHGLSAREVHFYSIKLTSNEEEALLDNFEYLEKNLLYIKEEDTIVQTLLNQKKGILENFNPSKKKFDQKVLVSFTIFGGEDYYDVGYFKFSIDQFGKSITNISKAKQ